MPQDWRTAYLNQARSDYDILQKLLVINDTPLCQQLHYLQMTTEKLAKALQSEAGKRPAKTHNSFTRFVQQAKLYRSVQNVCGFTDKKMFAEYLKALQPLAQQIEDLSPEGTDHPNPEYPWEAGNDVISPIDYEFPDLKFTDPKMIKMLRFIERCLTLS